MRSSNRRTCHYSETSEKEKEKGRKGDSPGNLLNSKFKAEVLGTSWNSHVAIRIMGPGQRDTGMGEGGDPHFHGFFCFFFFRCALCDFSISGINSPRICSLKHFSHFKFSSSHCSHSELFFGNVSVRLILLPHFSQQINAEHTGSYDKTQAISVSTARLV